jgi:hypothetical protein
LQVFDSDIVSEYDRLCIIFQKSASFFEKGRVGVSGAGSPFLTMAAELHEAKIQIVVSIPPALLTQPKIAIHIALNDLLMTYVRKHWSE